MAATRPAESPAHIIKANGMKRRGPVSHGWSLATENSISPTQGQVNTKKEPGARHRTVPPSPPLLQLCLGGDGEKQQPPPPPPPPPHLTADELYHGHMESRSLPSEPLVVGLLLGLFKITSESCKMHAESGGGERVSCEHRPGV